MSAYKTGISPKVFIDIKEVADKLGIGVTTAWAIVKECLDFPKKIKFVTRQSRWRETEVDERLAREIEILENGNG